MKITCFIFVAYVLVMAAAFAKLGTKHKSVEIGNSTGKRSYYDFIKKKNEYLRRLKLASGKEFLKPEYQVTNQGNNNIKRNDQLVRLTDSDFELVFKLKKSVRSNYVPTIIKILYSRDSTRIKNKSHLNKLAISQFEEKFHLKVNPAGIFVDSQLPFLAASPDGLIGDDSIVVVKFPLMSKQFSSTDEINRLKHKFLELKFEYLISKEINKYHYQIQGQLHITRKKFCYFVIWTLRGPSVRIIERDDLFWKTKMESFLRMFYLMYLLPEIIDPQYSIYNMLN